MILREACLASCLNESSQPFYLASALAKGGSLASCPASFMLTPGVTLSVTPSRPADKVCEINRTACNQWIRANDDLVISGKFFVSTTA